MQEMQVWYSIPGSGRSPDEGNGNAIIIALIALMLQNFCLGSTMDVGAWQSTVCGGAE